MASAAPDSMSWPGSARGSRPRAGRTRGGGWYAAGLASVALHGVAVLMAVALHGADDAAVDLPPVSVEIVLLDPVRPAPEPAVHPSAPAPASPAAAGPSPEMLPSPSPVPVVPKTASPPPPAAPPDAATMTAPSERSAVPPPAGDRAPHVVAAPIPRPRPAAIPVLTPTREAGVATVPKPRFDPVAVPLAAKALPASPAGASPGPPPTQSARRPGNDVPADSAAHPAADNAPPVYPRWARRRGLQGRLVLRVRIAADGAAREVEVIESSGHPVLDESARAAVAGWRFTPARRAGEAVASRLDIPVSFRLRR